MFEIIASSSFSISKNIESENSDTILMPKRVGDGYLFAVADGVGKTAGAKKASYEAIKTLEELHTTDSSIDFKGVFEKIRKKLIDISKENSQYHNMATTLTACFVTKDKVQYAHTGDSRLYFLEKNRLVKITKDQTEHEYLISEGIFSREKLKNLSRKNVLISALSPKMDLQLEEDTFFRLPSAIFIMSDGAYNFWEKNPKFSSSTMSNINAFTSSLQKRILRSGPTDDFSVVSLEVISG